LTRAQPTRVFVEGTEIRAARRERQLTLKQLGDISGYSASAVSRLERGRRRLDVETARLFAEVLHQPPERFGVTPRLDDGASAPGTAHLSPQQAAFRSAGDTVTSVLELGRWDVQDVERRGFLESP